LAPYGYGATPTASRQPSRSHCADQSHRVVRAQKKLFTVPPKSHGRGPVVLAWHPQVRCRNSSEGWLPCRAHQSDRGPLRAQGSFLATCGANRIVNVFNRQGEEYAEIPLDGSGKCTGLEWDKDGEMLAVMQEKSPVIKLWDANQNTESSLDTGLKEELSLLRWSTSGPQLAIGTAKGARSIEESQSMRRPPTVAPSSLQAPQAASRLHGYDGRARSGRGYIYLSVYLSI